MLYGNLYIVPTPIGNLLDLSPRAVETLRTVDLIAAEDTRHSAKLLQHFSITTPCRAYHEHSTLEDARDIAQRVAQGLNVALISDSGTPLISDPGYRLVRAVQDAGGTVIPLPGPSAVPTALSASGLPTDRFFFEGFLPAKRTARRNRLADLAPLTATLVFYEAPHRIVETLEDLVDVLGVEREAALCRELTKTFETIRRAPLPALKQWVAEDSDQQRGEIVLVVGGAREELALTPALQQLLWRLAEALPPRRAAALVADYSGLKARDLYQLLLDRQS